MKKIIFVFALMLGSSHNSVAQYQYLFQDPSKSVQERAANIVSLLTLDEKTGQMMNDAPAIERLGIPAYNWWNECLHGVARSPYRVTSFPQAIGMAATWDTDALLRMAQYASDEGRAIYNDASSNGKTGIYQGLTFWSPNVNIFRDPRWGRGQETYGEDPYLIIPVILKHRLVPNIMPCIVALSGTEVLSMQKFPIRTCGIPICRLSENW